LSRRGAYLVAAFLLAALSAVLGVAGVDALRWRGHLEGEDARFAAFRPVAWEANQLLPRQPVRRALGVEDDIAYREALTLFRLGRPTQQARDQGDLAVRAQADVELAGAASLTDDPVVRSRVATLRGVLAFEEARGSGPRAQAAIRRTLDAFRSAMLLDPANESAKYDLELVMRLLSPSEKEQERRRRNRQRSGSPGSGAGSSSGSTGF